MIETYEIRKFLFLSLSRKTNLFVWCLSNVDKNLGFNAFRTSHQHIFSIWEQQSTFAFCHQHWDVASSKHKSGLRSSVTNEVSVVTASKKMYPAIQCMLLALTQIVSVAAGMNNDKFLTVSVTFFMTCAWSALHAQMQMAAYQPSLLKIDMKYLYIAPFFV